MAEDVKIDDAEKAYAAAASDLKPARPADKVEAVSDGEAPVAAKAVKAAQPVKTAPVLKAAAKSKPARAKIDKVKAPKKASRKRAASALPAAVKPTTINQPVRRAPVAPVKPARTAAQLKETLMTTKTNDYVQPMADALGEIQTRAKAAYDKGTVALTDATDFAKGNVEAFVESTKILAAGVQDLSRSYVEEAKTAYETVTGDVKELAAVKSPTELFQLQGKIARRNFDALVATSSKNTDAFIKLASEAFAPLTGRVNLAAEKLAKVA